MGQEEIDNLFGEIMGAQDEMPNLDAPAPAKDDRPEGLHYVATNDSVATYDLVVHGRVVFQVLVNESATVEIPAFFQGHVHPQATAHQILVANRDRSVILPTNGVAIMGKHHLNTNSIRAYVLPRAVGFMIDVNRIGL